MSDVVANLEQQAVLSGKPKKSVEMGPREMAAWFEGEAYKLMGVNPDQYDHYMHVAKLLKDGAEADQAAQMLSERLEKYLGLGRAFVWLKKEVFQVVSRCKIDGVFVIGETDKLEERRLKMIEVCTPKQRGVESSPEPTKVTIIEKG